MAATQVSSSLYSSVHGVCAWRSARRNPIAIVGHNQLGAAQTRIRTAFATGSPLLKGSNTHQRKFACKTASVSIRCEQSTKEENNLDVWLGRLAMVGFAVAISVEIATGKGLLENFGLTSPLPTVALAVTALVGVLTAVFIFQSASKN
ncbi:stress enhanced protein 1, chloroplastic [Diospyros lotus]|uniref:stress enhanced protein 1, chloroplastic n=1 Tax=Diospyros lotus TaxID=55363 RepID=UPI00225173C5|nr:stress enhanced protein 1, chloroplastic [Diospyros lotus]